MNGFRLIVMAKNLGFIAHSSLIAAFWQLFFAKALTNCAQGVKRYRKVMQDKRYKTRLGRLAPPKGALTPISSCQNGKKVILKALLSKAFKITFQVVYKNWEVRGNGEEFLALAT